ncbi:MAG TPA: hypothetical protein VGR53_06720, partial [Nitrososphaerales archaeon]|nr:hypothetical protein [Nitrososphaerales archaeon]
MKPTRGPEVKNEAAVVESLGAEAGLSQEEATLYIKMLREGHIPVAGTGPTSKLLDKGMAIISGDGKRVIPVHPRLGIANHYRVWREATVREINERRMRTDKLILELIPVYEAAMEK